MMKKPTAVTKTMMPPAATPGSERGKYMVQNALPGFAPDVQANQVVAFAKTDRLAIHPVAGNCASQVWPNITSTCLRNAGSDAWVREARLVTASREP